MSKVIILNGSPRPDQCTGTALAEVARTLNADGIETEIIHIGKYGIKGCIQGRDTDASDRKAAARGLARAEDVLTSGRYDIVILDEIGIAVYFGMITPEQGLALLQKKAPGTELVMTGRYIPDYIIDEADLVTEMKDIRHYYEAGVEARDGIER